MIHQENPIRRIYGENVSLASKIILSEEALIFGDLAASSDSQVTPGAPSLRVFLAQGWEPHKHLY
jgi:hypothetical protein